MYLQGINISREKGETNELSKYILGGFMYLSPVEEHTNVPNLLMNKPKRKR